MRLLECNSLQASGLQRQEGEPVQLLRRWFDWQEGARTSVVARWVFLRALALIYFSAFYALLFQIKGLNGPQGIEPTRNYLSAVAKFYGGSAWWHAPSLFWISSSSTALMAAMWVGIAASVLALMNVWPRLTLFVCFICFLSFVTTAGDFSGYQSDGMLLEAGFISLFFAPPGIWPGLAVRHPASNASLWLLRWEWFRIYFESGLVKELSGDQQWRHFTAMDQYYQNGPLPTWIGYYVQHLPHWFQAATAIATLGMELILVFLLFFPRRVRLVLFFIVTPWEIGVILTGNYAFLNYLVLALGFLLVDDSYWKRIVPGRWLERVRLDNATEIAPPSGAMRKVLHAAGVALAGVLLAWIGYATTAEMANMVLPHSLWMEPAEALASFRIANQYGLFAVMTRGRYEVEFQGSDDGQTWKPYLFTHKPQFVNQAPGIYAPYQPRFDWNLWFASLGDWQQNDMVPITEEKLLTNDRDVIGLFRSDPFDGRAPRYVRAVLWQYWFTTLAEKRQTGDWWTRKLLGLYAPAIERTPDDRFEMVAPADELPPHD